MREPMGKMMERLGAAAAWRATGLRGDMSRAIWTAMGVGALQGCAALGTGYHLPTGDAARGRAVFEAVGCNACHRIDGVEALSAGGNIVLGGDTARVKTYGDLVTAIVNPSHRIARGYPRTTTGESSMAAAYLNEVLTVQQLIDVAAFLQAEYEVVPPPVRAYWDEYPAPDPAPGSSELPGELAR
jgi:mono/diheme cytochrome c family protein